MPRPLPSLLTPGLRRLLWLLLIPAAALMANTAYLVLVRAADWLSIPRLALGAESLPTVFQAMVLSHTGLGTVVVVLALLFLAAHLPRVWARRHRASVVSGLVMGAGLVLLLLTGLEILTEASSRANRWVWWLHAGLALVVPAGFLLHRFSSHVRPDVSAYRTSGGILAVATVGILLVHGVTARDPVVPAPVEAGGAGETFVPVGSVAPTHPFFPSPVATGSGELAPLASVIDRHADGADGELIGAETCSRCHMDVAAQWASSAHRFSSFNNPFYEASVEQLRETAPANAWTAQHAADVPPGMVKSKWCAGCHDPALLLTGRMSEEIDRTSAAAQAGLTCLSCHQVDAVHDRTGNGNYRFRDDRPDPYLFSGAAEGTLRTWLHDAALKAKPAVHRRQMRPELMGTSEFCATCHKVSLTPPVNDYRWIRGQNEFDNWDDSGVAHNAARTFYLPPEARNCQDCHMPLEEAPLGDVAADNGMVRSHRFLGANTALPFLRGDTAMLRHTEEFLAAGKVSVDVTAIATPEPVLLAADPGPVPVTAGNTVTIDVVVRNRDVGHTFPGGTNDSNEGWLEILVINAEGDTLGLHGAIRDDGHLDPDAHVFKAVLVDEDGRPIQMRNAQDIRATVFANVIPPGNANLAHYRIPLPNRPDTPVTVRVSLKWRKFDRPFTEFSYVSNPQGFPGYDEVPALPVTTLAQDEVTLTFDSDSPSPLSPAVPSDEWMRINDYGIGFLREANTRGASRAFAAVEAMRPDLVDGPLNLARSALQDGNFSAALDHLERAERIAPGNARVAWVWGRVLQEDGQYERAVEAYRRVLETFPNDRATWRNLGRTYYLDLSYDEALAAFARVLEIDPEDRVAHVHRMLIFRALGRTAEADAAAAAADYYSIDEAIQELTRAYRAENPGANRMAQPVRIHDVIVR